MTKGEHYLVFMTHDASGNWSLDIIKSGLAALGFRNVTFPSKDRMSKLGVGQAAAGDDGVYAEGDYSGAASSIDTSAIAGVVILGAVPVKTPTALAHYAEAGLVLAAGAFAAWWRWGRKRR